MVFYWSLSDSKSPQVSMTLLSILAVLKNVVWMVSTHTPISKSSSPFNNPLVTVPKAPITIGIIVTFMFHSFFQFSSKIEVLILLFLFFQFYSVVSQDSRIYNFANSLLFFFFFFFVDYYKVWFSGRDLVIRQYIKAHRSLCESFSRTDGGLCIYHLFVWLNLNFLHISQ